MEALYWKILKLMIWGNPPIFENPQIVGLISRMVISGVPGPENRQMPRLENSESRNPQHGALELDLSTCAVETCDTTTADLEVQHISENAAETKIYGNFHQENDDEPVDSRIFPWFPWLSHKFQNKS